MNDKLDWQPVVVGFLAVFVGAAIGIFIGFLMWGSLIWDNHSGKSLSIQLPHNIQPHAHYTGHIRGSASHDKLVVTYTDKLGVNVKGRKLLVTRARSGRVHINVYAFRGSHLDATAHWAGVAR